MRAFGVTAGDLHGPTAAGTAILARSDNGAVYNTNVSAVPLAPQALTPAGESLPHDNMQPYLTLNFCIALQGDPPDSV